MPSHSKLQDDIFNMPLNPMVFYARFQHIYEKIMENLNTKSLEKCREVSKSWMECIDNQNILWNRIVKRRDGNKLLKLVCKNGNLKLARFLIQRADEFKINPKFRDNRSKTSFWYGNTYVSRRVLNKEAMPIANAKSKFYYSGTSNGRSQLVWSRT